MMRIIILGLVVILAGVLLSAQETFTGTIEYDGRDRQFEIFFPSNYDDNSPLPVVIALHPSGGGASGMARITEFNTIAEREGFIVVYPVGPFGYWDYGYGTEHWQYIDDALDDPGFLNMLIDALITELSVDAERVYVVGYSNGARMAFRMACEAADRIAAVAAVSVTISTEITGNCPEESRLSVIYMHGRLDEITPWEGKPLFLNNMQISVALSAPETVEFWTTQNGCDPDMMSEDESNGIRLQHFTDCDDQYQVAFYDFEDGRHEWFRREDFDASEVIWQFFSENTHSNTAD